MAVTNFDRIVIGAGALGAASAYWLTRSGAGRVLVCEQFAPGHAWGSSDDHSRIIRHSYHSADYTALTPAMFATWAEVEAHSGEQLVRRTGGLDIAQSGTPGEDVLRLYRDAMDAASIPYELIDAAELRNRWPQWQVPDDTIAVHQAEAGLVDIRRATAAHLRLAHDAGAEVQPNCTVLDIVSRAGGVEVQTSTGTYTADSVIVCAGSWAGRLLARLGSPLTIELTQEQVQYFGAPDLAAFSPDRFPVWIWHAEHEYYGFPVYGERAVKAARDMTGRFVTQETRSFEPDPDETALIRNFLQKRLPAAVGPTVLAKTCVYDLPRDRELVFGALPGHANVSLAIGAGHAGKFASLIGRILADLATVGTTPYPISPFRPDRPSLAADAPARYRLGVDALEAEAQS